ncbi:MAG: ribonuclease R [Acholeplasmatales bacterium]|nr:ribonuclease R [Acholeplasmatales bacterium]
MTNEEIIINGLKRPYIHSVFDLVKITHLSKNTIINVLNKLEDEGVIYANDTHKLFYIKLVGKIQLKSQGFGFIKVEDSDKEYHVNEFDTHGALNGDTVSFYVLPSVKESNLDSAVVIDIIEHNNKFVYGLLCKKINKKGTSYFIASYDSNFNMKAQVSEKNLNGAIEGNIVAAEILEYNSSKKVTCTISRVLGYKDDPGVEIALIAEKYGFHTEFSEQTMQEIKDIPNSIDPNDFKDRKDYTNLKAITIDGKDSKDFDDAVYVERIKEGFRLYVLIADVSYYVREGSSLNADAYLRGTSVYLADRVIPMLPQKLSNGICSLNEGEYRLVNVCEMDIDLSGKLINYELHEGIMKSAHRMTYEDVNKMFNGDISLQEKYADIYPMLNDMLECSNLIRTMRYKKGAIDFDTAEYKVTLDSNGDPIEFNLRTRDKAELMIEDFMLKANETVAYHLNISNLPCLYRVHEEPDDERVNDVFNLINNLTGHKVKMPKNKVLPKDIQKAMELVKEESCYMAVNTLMLRAMKKARYSEESLGHYGLALHYYCHFTSPIRRYPDLIVHRILKALVFHPDKFEYEMHNFERFIHEAGIDTSSQERKSIDCEREVDDMLAAKFMQNHIGESYTGVIDSITSFGMFVMLDNGIEGLIHVTRMFERYNLNEKLMQLESRSNTFKIGQKVDIVCTDVDIKERKIDFMLKEDYEKEVKVNG